MDPQRLLTHVAAAVDGALARERGPIGAVAIGAFWHSLLGVDKTGRPVTPLMPWSDLRAAAQAERLREVLDERAIHARTGCRLHPSYWPARLHWFRERQRRDFARVDRWISFTELLEQRWLGRAGVSISQASGTGLMAQDTCAWDGGLLETCGLDENRVSPIVDLDDRAELSPRLKQRWPALAQAAWIPAVGDGVLNNVGAGCVTRSRAALMIGTSGALRVLWTARRGERVTVPFGLWRYRLDRTRPIIGGALSNGGNVREWLLRLLAGRQDDPQIARPRQDALQRQADALAPDVHGLTMLPFLAGTRSPDYLVDARGAISGLALTTTPAHLLRAAMESIAYRFAAIFAELRTTVRVTDIVAAGGGLERSAAWTRILADVLGRPVRQTRQVELTSRGAAALAFEQLGMLDASHIAVPRGRLARPGRARGRSYRRAAARQAQLLETLTSGSP
jgi:gluconokinase